MRMWEWLDDGVVVRCRRRPLQREKNAELGREDDVSQSVIVCWWIMDLVGVFS